MSVSIALPQVTPERGFLPEVDPLKRLPAAFDAWEEVAHLLPKLLAADRVRDTIADLPPFPTNALRDPRERERAMVLLSYIGHAYVWGSAQPAKSIPAVIAMPWHKIAEGL